MVREDEPGDKRLVAYVVRGCGRDGGRVAELREHLRGQAAGVHGAVGVRGAGGAAADAEREGGPARAAGAASGAALGEAEEAPRTPVEEMLAGILARGAGAWSGSGSHDNFFELGGHSLLATQVVSRVREASRGGAAAAGLFETPTVRGSRSGGGSSAARGGVVGSPGSSAWVARGSWRCRSRSSGCGSWSSWREAGVLYNVAGGGCG